MRINLLAMFVAALGAAGAVLSGCSTPSINPIYSEDESEVVTDDRVVGVWFQDDPKKEATRYHVGKRADDKTLAYPMRITGGDAAEKHGRFEFRLVKLGAHTYADFTPDKAERDRLGGRFALAAMPMHVIMPVTIAEDRVSFRPLDPTKVRALIEQSPAMTPHAIRDKLVILTGDTRRVQQFFRKVADGDEVFGDTVVVVRVKDEPGEIAPAPPPDAATGVVPSEKVTVPLRRQQVKPR